MGENGAGFCTRNPKYCIQALAGLVFSCSSAWNSFLKIGNGRFLSHNQRNSWFPRDIVTVAVICVQWGKQEKHHVFCCLCFQCVNTFTHLYLTSPRAQTQLFRKSVEKLCDQKAEMWYNPNNSSVTAQSSYHNLFTHSILPLNPSCSLRLVILTGWRSGCIPNGRFFSDSMSNMREIPCLQQVF